MTEQPLSTRAVTRLVEPGTRVICPGCKKPVSFEARKKNRQVICNVYEDDRWNRCEHWHLDCYEGAGNPHGESVERMRKIGRNGIKTG